MRNSLRQPRSRRSQNRTVTLIARSIWVTGTGIVLYGLLHAARPINSWSGIGLALDTSAVVLMGYWSGTIARKKGVDNRGAKLQGVSRPCAGLIRLVDWIPGPRLRKRVRKLVADEVAHVDELQKAGRFGAARWIAFCAWIHAIVIVLRGPLAAVLDWVKRSAA
jgi:hypothetical protein